MDTSGLEKDVEAFVNIPKVELHAHLNGSLSQNTLKKLNDLKRSKSENCHSLDSSNLCSPPKDLSECFKLFSMIHELTDSPEAIYLATCDVIRDFYNDGVYYLELRTTPKEIENSMNQECYVQTVLKAVEATVTELKENISVKLLLSVDRKRPFDFAEKTVKIAEKYFTSSESIVGIDLSGDPTVNDACVYTPLLEYAKKVGLKLAVHIAEVPNCNEESKKLLKLTPDRLGHGTFLHPSKGGSVEILSILNEQKIPLEICLTSNVFCKTVPSYEEHHFQLFRNMKYPCTLCTDDKGIFNTTLSKEYCLATKYYSITDEELYNLSFSSIDYIFATSKKDDLKKLWKLKRNQLFNNLQ